MTLQKQKRRASRTIAARIHKLSGQLGAIEGMVAHRRPCAEILAQVEAVRSGLGGVAAIIINDELMRLSKRKGANRQEIVKLTRVFIEQT